MLSFCICVLDLERRNLLQSARKGLLPTFSQGGKSFKSTFAKINISTAHSSVNHREIKLHFWSFAFNETIYIPYFILFPNSCRCWKNFPEMSKEYFLSVYCCSCHQYSDHADSWCLCGTVKCMTYMLGIHANRLSAVTKRFTDIGQLRSSQGQRLSWSGYPPCALQALNKSALLGRPSCTSPAAAETTLV